MLVQRVHVRPEVVDARGRDTWPFGTPAVDALIGEGLTLDKPVTILVGENGTGKSTIVTAIAEAFGLDAHGGRAGRKYVNDRPQTPLGEMIELDYTPAGSRMRTAGRAKQKGYFLRAETAFGFMSAVSGMAGYWDADITTLSHGEGFRTVFDTMFTEPGLYVMDEPEAALSFASCLRLVGLIHQLGQSGAQIVCATHSPILAATPDAAILELTDHGVQRTSWDDLELVQHWRRYLDKPDLFLRHIIDTP